MSRYSRRVPKESNSKISSSSNYKTETSQQQAIPGTPIQQMWHILNFHETRLTQLSQFLQNQESNSGNTGEKGENTSETEHMIQYNTLLQQVQELNERVERLETENKELLQGNMVSLSIEEDLQHGLESAV